MKPQDKSKVKIRRTRAPGALVREPLAKLAGESSQFPNLQIPLTDSQLVVVQKTLEKLDRAHFTRVPKHGPHRIESDTLSIHPLDFLSVLSHFPREAGNEMDIFRLRRQAADELRGQLARARNDIKKHNLKLWLKMYEEIRSGAEAQADGTEIHDIH